MSARRVVPLEALLDRRAFCQAAGAAAAVLWLPSCGGVAPGLPPLDGFTLPDAARQFDAAPPDLTELYDLAPPSDLASCGAFRTELAAAQFLLDTATLFPPRAAFVCRDAGGLFTLSALCTHRGCYVGFRSQAVDFLCPCHGARFTFDGVPTFGPAPSPLVHYATCLDGDGVVAFDRSAIVDPAVRLKA